MRSKDGVDSPPLAEVQLPSAPPLMPPPLTSVRIRPGYWYLVDLCQDANELVHDTANGNRYAAESVLLG